METAIKETFNKYYGKIKREGKEDLLNYLETTGFFTAPASTQHHLYEQGGLLEHSVNVVSTMFKLAPKLGLKGKEIEESMVISGLFHDLGKSSYFGKPMYVENVLKSGKLSEAKPYVTNKELLAIPHEISGVHILSQFIDLTEEETFAILYHNGLYTSLGYGLKGNEQPLQMLLHFADMWASRVIER